MTTLSAEICVVRDGRELVITVTGIYEPHAPECGDRGGWVIEDWTNTEYLSDPECDLAREALRREAAWRDER